jgi:hypothetical protein
MPRFQKKPVQVQAWPVVAVLRSAEKEWETLPKPIADAYERGDVLFLPKTVEIKTLEGRMTASGDDWIIQGVSGELYPCKPDIFQKTYTAVPCEGFEQVCTGNRSTKDFCPACR